MADVTELRADLQEVETIHTLSGVMRDIAASRMEDLRDRFQRNRMYYDEVRGLFALVRRLMSARYDMTQEARTGRSLAIAVTSNSRFYGGLNKKVIDHFIGHFDESDDHIVIGNTGNQIVARTSYFNDCDYMHFPDDKPAHKDMWQLVEQMRAYDTVFVYYPRYKNPFQQVPDVIDVNATPDTSTERKTEEFIVEPNLPVLHDFFLTQIKWMIFERVLLETDLSRTAARLMKMHTAEETSEDMIENLNDGIRETQRQQRDVQLFESIIGVQQWRKLQEKT